MASFAAFIPGLMAREGGYQRLSADPGNYNSAGQLVGTNYGISAPVYEDWINRLPSAQDMQQMTRQAAERIYLASYWNPLKSDQIISQPIANILVDHGVNRGTGSAARLMQSTLKAIGFPVSIDGVIGPESLAAINQAPEATLHQAYKLARIADYQRLGSKDFIRGWINRVNSFPDLPGYDRRLLERIDWPSVAKGQPKKKKRFSTVTGRYIWRLISRIIGKKPAE